MSNATYIHGVMLNTGGRAPSYRHDVTESALVVTRPLLDLAEPQWIQDLGVVRAEHGAGWVLLRVEDETGPIAAIAVATRSLGSKAPWLALHGAVPDATLVTDPDVPPALPWCGLALSDRMRGRPAVETRGIVVLARVLGWAWMERNT